ncbi:MAG TPA: Pr6Pr family membrane protein [Ferruginibacter sp.]|nr:Pr6Pr family membrane protein [Ferruginibacter sp.]
MLSQLVKAKQFMAVVGFLTGCFALLLQLYLIIQNRTTGVTETLIRYFSFFTISSNILATICFYFIMGDPEPGAKPFFARAKTIAAITVYMFIVGLVYNAVLRGQHEPLQGQAKIANELLHVMMPLLIVIYWLVFAEKNMLEWKNIFPWLIYPFVYCVYTLIRGAYVHFYPYPFMNVDFWGLSTVLLHCLYMCIAFLVVAILIVAIAKVLTKITMEKLTT